MNMNKSIGIFLLSVQFALVIGLNDVFQSRLHSFAVKNKTKVHKFHLYTETQEMEYDTVDIDNAIKGCPEAALIRHNFYRKIHEMPLLVLSKELNKYSQQRAYHLANEDTYHHMPNKTFGENVFSLQSLDKNIHDVSFNAVENWYNEIDYFDFAWEEGVMSAASKSHRFTQMIWKGSKELGAGAAKSENGGLYLVCYYNPPGNIIGQFSKNINPPTERMIRSKAGAADYSKLILLITCHYTMLLQ